MQHHTVPEPMVGGGDGTNLAAATDLAAFDPHGAPFATDPYPLLDRMREEAPVLWHRRLNAFLLTRYEDVRCALADEDRKEVMRSPVSLAITWTPSR